MIHPHWMSVSEVFGLCDEKPPPTQVEKTILGTMVGKGCTNYSLTSELVLVLPAFGCVVTLTSAQDGLVPLQLTLVVLN